MEFNECSIESLSDLSKDQRVVLYTLFLCYNDDTYTSMDGYLSMGNIDVRDTVEELVNRNLVVHTRYDNRVCISSQKRYQIMKSYKEDCLLNDIDKEFFMQVASDFSVFFVYTEVYIFNSDKSSRGACPISLMRIIVQSQTEAKEKQSGEIKDLLYRIVGKDILPPGCFNPGILKKLGHFILMWCRLMEIRDPIGWADTFPTERLKCVYSANTIFPFSNTEIKETDGLFLTPLKSSILCTILLSENYKISANAIKEKNQEVVNAFPSLSHAEMDTFSDTIDEMEKQDKNITVEKETKVLGFKSDNVRHQVMGYFVMNCLRTDEDYESYIKLSSVDSLLEYVRTWRYSKGENKRCLYLPEKMEDALIKRLGLAAIIHVMMDEGDYDNDNCNEERRRKVISNVKVPRELFDWNYDARCRYVECARKGTQIIHRARAMIVGCAGAGKTTLLKRLQRKKLEEITDVKSTVGLEVHEDIFEVSQDQDSLRALTDESNKEGKTLLSVLDFGGQCAYYACHQVYLSRRAFYILVIDMSKSFKDKVDKALCDQEGTMFGDWTYGEYLLFWMKSIHFYCAKDVPVILVGTHLDRSEHQTSDEFYRRILDHLRHDENLKVHLNRKRCFIIGFLENDEQCLDQFLDLEKCIVSIAKEDRWKETIPRDWAICEVILRKLKSTERMLSRKAVSSEFLYYIQEKSTNVQDVLKLFHDIGIILHFDEECLSETIVIDIQWFVDAFKNIITDPNHALDLVRDHEEWMNFYQNGYLSNALLQKIWKSRRLDNSTQKSILQYMQRLGLIFVKLNSDFHYIPCMNKRTFDAAHEECLRKCQNKTSVLVFRFPFLPWFVYFRLIVACMTREWRVLNDEGLCLFKNIACFHYKEHIVALTVNNTSIQLQVFRNITVKKVLTLEVRGIIERLLDELTGRIHTKLMYTVGYQCSMNDVLREYDDCFVAEKEIHRKGEINCPRHELTHTLSEPYLVGYWKKDCNVPETEVANTHKDSFIHCYEEALLKFHFQKFEKLTKVGRKALQIYFDTVFPTQDLANMSSRKNKVKKAFHLNDDQFARLFPADESIPCSESFDVTLMYQMLRNRFPSLPQPAKGWGKTPDTCDKSETDDVERIRIYRNQAVHEPDATSKLEKKDLEEKGRDLMQAIARLSKGVLRQEMMNALKNST